MFFIQSNNSKVENKIPCRPSEAMFIVRWLTYWQTNQIPILLKNNHEFLETLNLPFLRIVQKEKIQKSRNVTDVHYLGQSYPKARWKNIGDLYGTFLCNTRICNIFAFIYLINFYRSAFADPMIKWTSYESMTLNDNCLLKKTYQYCVLIWRFWWKNSIPKL